MKILSFISRKVLIQPQTDKSQFLITYNQENALHKAVFKIKICILHHNLLPALKTSQQDPETLSIVDTFSTAAIPISRSTEHKIVRYNTNGSSGNNTD